MAVKTNLYAAIEVDGISYKIYSTNMTASVTKGNYKGVIVIPSTIVYQGNTYSVTTIDVHAFLNCSKVTSLTIGDNVTKISDAAFSGCGGLTSLTIPNNVTSIGQYAFNGCSSLTSVTIPNSVSYIGYSAFGGCNSLTFLSINCQVVTTVFRGSPIQEVVLGRDVEKIANQAFYGCTSLTSINIPNGVTSIGEYAFANCSSLTSMTIPNSVTEIGWEAFHNCSSLSSITIGNGISEICYGTFIGCISLSSLTIGNCVTTIGQRAFEGCASLTSVTIPNSVATIGENAFQGCTGLSTVTIPNSVITIGANAFQDCTSMTTVTIPNSVTTHGGNVFKGCTNLTSATLNCINADGWFSNDNPIKEVVLGDGVSTIGPTAFKDCISLTIITIGNNVTQIGYDAFRGCISLNTLTIGNSVTSIESYAFEGCSSLTSVTIPNSVTNIGVGTFSGCSDLASLTLGNGVTNIGYQAFYKCTSLTSVIIPNSVTRIDRQAFQDCSNLTSVTIGENVTELYSNSFSGCDRLYYVTYNCKNVDVGIYGRAIRELVFGNNVNSIGATFGSCTNLTTLIIGNSVTRIGSGAFRGCENLTSITFGNSVTTIDWEAFAWCKKLSSVTIPSKVTSIGINAFTGCSSLDSLFINAREFNSEIFTNCNKLKEITLGENVENVYLSTEYNKIRCLAQTPPKLSYEYNNRSYVNILEVPYGYSPKYAINDNWKKIPLIYSVKNNTRYYPIAIVSTGRNVVSANSDTNGCEAKGGEVVEIKANSSLSNNPLIMLGTQNVSHFLIEKGYYKFIVSEHHSENTINSFDFPLTNVTLYESGTLIDKINLDDILNIENLKITGNINGTDLLVIRKMENLKLLDLKDAHIVDGGMSYYKNYVTSKNKIGNDFFSDKEKLYTVILPQDITEICDGAFFKCYELRTISIPKTVKIMNASMFSYCDKFNSVHIEDLAAYCSIKFSQYVWRYQERDMYLNDKKIVDMVIPDGVKSISAYAFYVLNGLNSLVIPSSVTKIGNYAFDCPIQESITCYNPTPPEIDVRTFRATVYDDVILYVPKGSKTLYWLHPYWENFKNIVELGDTSIDDVIVDQHQQREGVYTIDGIKLSANAGNIENLPKGIYIINGKKVIIK